jgi:hypothetical protein
MGGPPHRGRHRRGDGSTESGPGGASDDVDGYLIVVAHPSEIGGAEWPTEVATVMRFREGKVVSMKDYPTVAEAHDAIPPSRADCAAARTQPAGGSVQAYLVASLATLRVRRSLRRCGDFLLEDPPPDSFVREPRKPRPLEPGGAIALKLPDVCGPRRSFGELQRTTHSPSAKLYGDLSLAGSCEPPRTGSSPLLTPQAQWSREAQGMQKGRNVRQKRAAEKAQRAQKGAWSAKGGALAFCEGAGLLRAWPQAPRPGSQGLVPSIVWATVRTAAAYALRQFREPVTRPSRRARAGTRRVRLGIDARG